MRNGDFEHEHPRKANGRFRSPTEPVQPDAARAQTLDVESLVPRHMPAPVHAEAREGFCIWVRFDDGVEGEVDLSGIAGRGVFSAWDDRDFFETVHPHPERRAVAWGMDHAIDIDPDRLHMEITGSITAACIP